MIAVLPGFLQLPAFSITAEQSRTTLYLAGSTVGSVDKPPVQQSGSAEGLPHLVDSAATQADASGSASKKAKRPKGSLPVEKRHKTSDEPAKGGLKSPPPLPAELKPSSEGDPDVKDAEPEKDAKAADDGKSAETAPMSSEVADALATARRTGSPVVVDSETTESSITYANGDGTLTTEVTGGIARVKQDGKWVPVDTSLVEIGGVLRAKAAKADVEFSLGGSADPFVKLTKGKGKSLALRWPTPLPKPVIEGNTATYVDAAGKGADLVVTMLPDGFSEDVVLRERPDSPVEIKMEIDAEGLTVAETSSGGLSVTSDDGKVVASAPEPVMYDAAVSDFAAPLPLASSSPSAAARAPSGRDQAARERHRSAGKIDTRVVTEKGRQTLVLRPDAEFLKAPDTVYPVKVDPSVTLTPSTDTYVISSSPSSSFSGSSLLYVSNAGFGEEARSFIDFNTPSLTGATVTSATLSLTHDYDSSFKVIDATISRVTSPWGYGTTWRNQPTYTSAGSVYANGGDRVNVNVKAIAQAWASGSPNYGFALTDCFSCLIYSSESSKGVPPKLTVTYTANSAPAVPAPAVSPTVTGETGGVVTSLTPVLSAVLSDPDGGSLSGEFQVQVGSTVVWSGTASGVSSGGKATVAVPSGKLSDGQMIQYRARAYDGSAYSAWSGWQTAQVTSMDLATVMFQQFTPVDNTQVGSLTPALSAYAQVPGEAATSYWYQVCAGPKDNWTWCESSTWVKGAWMVPSGKLQWGKTYWWYAQAATSAATATSSWRSFTTVPEQASINAQLAAGTNGRDFDHVTGNFTRTETDLVVATVGPPLSVIRTYNSLDPRTDGAFGAGWTTRWDTRLEDEPLTSTVLITYPDGRQWRFAAKGDGTYASPAGTYATLASQPGGTWRLMDKASTSYWFDSAGRLVKVTDSQGRTQTLQYGSDGKLAKATATGGRSLTFTWSGSHVTSVISDPVDGTPVIWTYTYDGDYLVKVCPPASGTACTRYDYSDDSRYRSTVLDTKPVGYWRLNETGTGLGSVVSNFVGSISGIGDGKIAGGAADATGGVTSPLDGASETAMTFKGTANSAYVSLPASVVSGRGSDVTIEAWFKTTASGTIIGYQNSAANAPSAYTPAIYVGTDGKLRGQFWTGTAAPIASNSTVNDGNWHHVALSGAKNTQTLYLDGQAVGSIAKAITNLGQWDARIGYGFGSSSWPGTVSSSGPFPFNGSIDEVAIYGKPLRLEQIATHHRTKQVRRQLTKVTLPSGRVAAANTYAADGGRLLTNTDDDGGQWKLSAPAYTKDSAGTSLANVTVTDPHNGTLKFVNDTSRDDRIVSWTDQLAKKTTYDYDTGGFKVKVTDRNGNVREYANDVRGNLLAMTVCKAAGSCASEHYTYHLDIDNLFDARNDQVVEFRDARSSDETDDTYLTTIEYDQYGNKVKQTGPATTDFPSGRSASWTYTVGTEPAVGGGTTPAGLLKTQTDRKGNQTTLAYTSAGDLAKVTQPSGMVLDVAHDALGRVAASTKVSDAVPAGVTTTFGYDQVGRLIRTTEAGVKNEVTDVTHTREKRTTYDADGNPLTEVSADLTGGDPDRKVTFTYDTYGRVETVTDPEGGVKRYAYDHKGRKTSFTDERGTVYAYGYTNRDELATITLMGWTGSPVDPQPARNVVIESNAYDPGGRLASKTDAMGRTTAYTYYGDERLAKVIAKGAKLNGSSTGRDVVVEDNTYDPVGNLIKQVTGGGATRVDAVYDAAGRLTAKTLDPQHLARTTSYGYDANDNITKISRTADGTDRAEVTEIAYNDLDKPIRQTVNNDGQDLVTSFAVDDRGLVAGITDPRGNLSGADPADFTTTIRYDLAGRAVEAIQPAVMVERGGGAPARTQPITRMGYNTAGELTHTVDPEGRTSVATYDLAGRPTSQAKPAYTPPGGAAVTPITRFAYDAAGQQISVTDERGKITTAVYDGLGRRVQVTDPKVGDADPGRWTYAYDLAGELLSATDPTGARTESTYDDLGRAITQTTIERRPSAAAYVTRLEYDDAGRLTKQTRPAGDVISRTYDASGAVMSETDALGNAGTFDYDLAGRVTKVTNPDGTSTAAEYDLAGRKVAVKELDDNGDVLRTQVLGYDAAGNPTSTTTAEGHTLRQAYDAGNRLVEVKEPVSAEETVTTSFGYDAAGARTRSTDGRGNATVTTYNALGLVESMVEPSTAAHPNASDRTWTTIYDAAGNPVADVAPGGVQVNRTFDELNRVTTMTGSGAEAATADKTFAYDLAGHLTSAGDLTFTYNDRGNLLKVTGPGGDISAYAYDANGRLTQRQDTTGTASFTWDGDDRLTQATDPVTGTTISYGYDSASRLTSMGYGTGGASRSFSYDPLSRLVKDELKSSSDGQISQISYGYDLDDNMVSKTTAGTAGAGSNAYTYDQAGRLTSWTAPDGQKTDYGWDAAGNRTRAGDKTYTYDERNRLTSGDGSTYTYTPRGTLAEKSTDGRVTISKFDAFDRLIQDGAVQYGYDASDRMTSRVKGTDTERFTYDGLTNNLIAVADGSNTTKVAYGRDALGNTLSLSGAGGAHLALTDLHGDLIGTFTATGTALADSTAYTPFGEVITQTGTTHDLGYQGEWTDPDTGNVNMHARWYQPGTATFASRDSWNLEPVPSVQLNRYAYANASPLMGIDPTGHQQVEVCLAGTICGGGYICGSNGSCHQTDTAARWWSEYTSSIDYRMSQPQFSDERARELGVTSTGRPAPKGFWEATEGQRETYIRVYEVNTYMSDAQLQRMWEDIKKTLIEQGDDVNTIVLAAQAYKEGPKRQPCTREGCPYPYLQKYIELLQYKKEIAAAAKKHKVDRAALTAVLIYEGLWLEPKGGKPGDAIAWLSGYGDGISLGIAQMEIYKARAMLNRYYSGRGDRMTNKEIATLLNHNAGMAIELAAAYMRYLKESIVIDTPGGSRHINDWEAALAYCGCTGVTWSRSKGRFVWGGFVKWIEGGSAPQAEAEKRRDYIFGWVRTAAYEYWKCADANC
ncbi:DNRLRE domain-containing protein [Sphaerimonospora mesophila]|uniref:DNRLRE domain-containing protein n=1 Tax=Sphaerimonospora mesophila TaxID=37483 RepID=UPI001365EC19